MRGQVRCDLPAPNAGTGQAPPSRQSRGSGNRSAGVPPQSRSIRGQVTCGLPAARAGHRSRAALAPGWRSRDRLGARDRSGTVFGAVQRIGDRSAATCPPHDRGQVKTATSPVPWATGEVQPPGRRCGGQVAHRSGGSPGEPGTGHAVVSRLSGRCGDRSGATSQPPTRGQVRHRFPGSPEARGGQVSRHQSPHDRGQVNTATFSHSLGDR